MAFALLAVLLGLALAVGLTGIEDDDPPVTIDGTDDNDEIYAGERDNLIRGFDGNDSLHGGPGDDTLEGGAGNDLLYTGPGDDLADGGAGNDTLESWDGGNDTLLGGAGDDSFLLRSPGSTLVDGGAGNDFITWGDGAATINGGQGDDEIFIGGLRDGLLDGGAGTDTLYLGGLFRSVTTLSLGRDGSGIVTDGEVELEFRDFEIFDLPYDNVPVIFDASDSEVGVTVVGNLEDERFGDGYSTITGGSGDDHFINGTVMDGGAGDDLLVRTSGGGTLTGGEGADVFEIQHNRGYSGYETFISETTRITDFTPGEDRISLVVNYDEHFVDPDGRVYDNDAPEITIVEDPDTGETHVMVNNSIALRLEGVSGLTLADIEVELRAY